MAVLIKEQLAQSYEPGKVQQKLKFVPERKTLLMQMCLQLKNAHYVCGRLAK